MAQAIDRVIAETFRDPGSPIRVRVGLHVGETVREADDFFGLAVAYAQGGKRELIRPRAVSAGTLWRPRLSMYG